jgi:hypothetical protein
MVAPTTFRLSRGVGHNEYLLHHRRGGCRRRNRRFLGLANIVARMSGVIEAEAGKCKLSTLGREIVDPQKGEKRPALVHADMTGKVFKK